MDLGDEAFDLQITIADPVWDSLANGGYDHRLVMEGLNRQEVVVGSRRMRRLPDGSVMSDAPVSSIEQDFTACASGLAAALTRKIPKLVPGCRLLIHARGYEQYTIDFSLGALVDAAAATVESIPTAYIVTEHSCVSAIEGKVISSAGAAS